MTKAPLRVGLIGYGLAGEVFHAPVIAATPGLELVGVVTRRPEAAAKVAERYPDATVVASAEALLAGEAGPLDLVVVATTNDSHVPLARAAIEAGVACVVDKPIAPDAASARELDALAQERGVALSVFQNRRWDGDFLTLRALLDDGTLGEVRRLESRFEVYKSGATGNWRESADPAMVGGVLFDLGAHLVDQALELCGPVTRVYAETDTRREGVGADDDAFIALTHACGARSHLWMSTVVGEPGPRFRVLGSKAAFTSWGLDGQEPALKDGRTPDEDGWGLAERPAVLTRGTEREEHRLLAGQYRELYAQMAAAVRGEGPVPVTVESTARALDVLEAARTSARTGVVVELAVLEEEKP